VVVAEAVEDPKVSPEQPQLLFVLTIMVLTVGMVRAISVALVWAELGVAGELSVVNCFWHPTSPLDISLAAVAVVVLVLISMRLPVSIFPEMVVVVEV